MKQQFRLLLVFLALLSVEFFTPALQAQIKEDYKISAQDVITIDVFGEKDLANKDFKVSSGGMITYPLLGEVMIMGLTVAEVNNLVRELLRRDYIIDPQVSVTVKEYSQRIITVMGEVNKPGALVLPGEQRWSIMDAIGQAGGPSKLANTKRIEFTRKGITKQLNLKDLTSETDPTKVIWLEPGDSISIPQTIF